MSRRLRFAPGANAAMDGSSRLLLGHSPRGNYTSAEAAHLPRKAREMRTLGIVAIISGVLAAFNVSAMEYWLTGRTIYATGAVETGDAATLSRLIRDNNLADGFDDYVVRLNSPGGLVLEGMEVGRVIRDARLETLIVRGDICASACALAFLGGTRQYATGNGVGRRLEFGAMLGFHGFRSATDAVRVENETLSVSRVPDSTYPRIRSTNEGCRPGLAGQYAERASREAVLC